LPFLFYSPVGVLGRWRRRRRRRRRRRKKKKKTVKVEDRSDK
jgi:hypothetical protein